MFDGTGLTSSICSWINLSGTNSRQLLLAWSANLAGTSYLCSSSLVFTQKKPDSSLGLLDLLALLFLDGDFDLDLDLDDLLDRFLDDR